MIAQLEGQVTWTGEESLIVNVHGVGYLVFGTAAVLHAASEAASLHSLFRVWIETCVREDAIILYGFLTHSEQHLFRLLLGVQGVGARVALALLSTFGAASLQNLILTQDKKELTRADGVGNKLAERLVLELKDKIAKGMMRYITPTSHLPDRPSHTSSHPLLREGFDALASLGYRPSESLPALERAFQELGCPPEDLNLEVLIHKALFILNLNKGS